MSGGEKIEMIIDCDPGVDDAVAIMMALSQPSVNLLGLTCVGGNTPIDNVLRNALRVLRVCNKPSVSCLLFFFFFSQNFEDAVMA